jgi:ribosomal protein L39E
VTNQKKKLAKKIKKERREPARVVNMAEEKKEQSKVIRSQRNRKL